MRIILIHGYKASPNTNFWPWLKRELIDRRFEVIAPELPNPEEPDRDLWTKTLLEAVGTLDENDIIVGHSLGGAAALRLLESAEARTTPHACVLISTPWMIKDDKFRGFFLTELDHDVLMWRASKYVVIHAKDDQVIPVNHAERYAQVFHADLITPETGGHFDGPEYPVILETILKVAGEPIVFEPGMSLDDEYADIIK
jgi:predicted alpha/beta hydrolase family esterase